MSRVKKQKNTSFPALEPKTFLGEKGKKRKKEIWKRYVPTQRSRARGASGAREKSAKKMDGGLVDPPQHPKKPEASFPSDRRFQHG